MARAARYLEESQGAQLPEMAIVQKLRQDAEQARQAALEAQSEAERSREALNQRLADLHRQGENDAKLAEARARLQPGDRVVVPRFGYDRPGRVVKIDARKKMAIVAIGQMQWDVAIDDLIPQVLKAPGRPPPRGSPGRICRRSRHGSRISRTSRAAVEAATARGHESGDAFRKRTPSGGTRRVRWIRPPRVGLGHAPSIPRCCPRSSRRRCSESVLRSSR